MKRLATIVVTSGITLVFGLLTTAAGQETDPEQVLEARLLGLEQSVARLDTQLQMRTNVSGGPQDRVSRDFDLEQRLNTIERQVQQLGIQMSNLQREVQAASRAASQAQNDAQQARQLAQNASLR